jgi:SAM-dependent methyltransferase
MSLNVCTCDIVWGKLHRKVAELVADYGSYPKTKLLDIGCWDGLATLEYGKEAGLTKSNLYGIEVMPEQAKLANKVIQCKISDLEKNKFPFPSNFFDVVIANQVFEHLKNIYLPLSEIKRVIKPGGILIFSVPNLSSFHNRLLLVAGRQPTSIRSMGPHVRGFSQTEVRELLEFNGHFQVVRKVGVGFYPSFDPLTDSLAKALPNLSHTIIWVAEKRKSSKPTWLEEISSIDSLHMQSVF